MRCSRMQRHCKDTANRVDKFAKYSSIVAETGRKEQAIREIVKARIISNVSSRRRTGKQAYRKRDGSAVVRGPYRFIIIK